MTGDHTAEAGAGDSASRSVAQQDRMDTAEASAPPTRHRATLDRDYVYGVNLTRAARYKRYARRDSDPLYRPLRIYTTDPVRSAYEGAETVLQVPYEPLDPGPSGALLVVDDIDTTTQRAYPGVDLDNRAVLLQQGRPPSPGDIFFHQQMVYAVCSEVIARFTLALGRDPSWGFARRDDGERDRLRIRPHYAEDANAYYDPGSGELRFGYFAAGAKPGPGMLPRGVIYTCLAHDIIAHEMSHALLDGMRSQFATPTNPDVFAFHEAFADLVAILQHFTQRDSVRLALRCGGGAFGDSTIFSVAEQFGRANALGPALRIALGRGSDMRKYGHYDDPHDLGMVLVAAVLDAFQTIFERRVGKLKSIYRLSNMPRDNLHPDFCDLLAEEATRVAGQFLSLCIRAIDYCPPVDITFGEYLRALITADRDLVEDDPWHYREALISAFGRRDIFPSDVGDLSESSLLWRPPLIPLPKIPELDMSHLHFGVEPGVSADAGQLRRQANALANLVTTPKYMGEFGLTPAAGLLPSIESIRAIRRVGPDRQIRFGLVAEVLQRWSTTVNGGTVRMLGGSTIILGGEGEIRFIIRKAVDDFRRAERQAAFAATRQGMAQLAAVATGGVYLRIHKRRHAAWSAAGGP